MPCVHYKFSSQLVSHMVVIQGQNIKMGDLKQTIMEQEKLKASRCDLQISNAQTREEYTDETALIPKNTSVIVRRIPAGDVTRSSKAFVISRTEPVSGASGAIAEAASSSSPSLAQLVKTVNLAEADASEEEKIKAMMVQSSQAYDPANYLKRPPPANYICFRCLKTGHFYRNCPTIGDKSFQPAPRIRKSTGIPMSFLVEVEDPSIKGAKITGMGKFAVPLIDAEAYAKGKKEKHPFLSEAPSSSSEEEETIPTKLLCTICRELMTDAAIIPCCRRSFCDECIRMALLESEDHTCPACHLKDVSPDFLESNKFLRQAINKYKNEVGSIKRFHQIQLAPPPATTAASQEQTSSKEQTSSTALVTPPPRPVLPTEPQQPQPVKRDRPREREPAWERDRDRERGRDRERDRDRDRGRPRSGFHCRSRYTKSSQAKGSYSCSQTTSVSSWHRSYSRSRSRSRSLLRSPSHQGKARVECNARHLTGDRYHGLPEPPAKKPKREH